MMSPNISPLKEILLGCQNSHTHDNGSVAVRGFLGADEVASLRKEIDNRSKGRTYMRLG